MLACMTIALQPSLFDAVADTGFGPLAGHVRRTPLAHGAWVDHLPGWLSGADRLFAELVDTVPWRAERRQMYDRVVDVPRLLSFYGEDDPLPHPLVAEGRDRLNEQYAGELGEPFRTSGLCFYRDGRDSVAWHGDRIGRGRSEDTMVAILSLGEARKLMLRPNGGGAGHTLAFALGHGDLLVMGGSCQRTWEHCVPKSARPCGPRISVQYRPRAVL
jgi:alkylated DNA repair dioxygenase AlkB